jgi:hypothetical protein
MYDEFYSWFGCCTGTRIADCNVVTACVPSKSLDQCLESESCFGDPLAMAWYVPNFMFFLSFEPSFERQLFLQYQLLIAFMILSLYSQFFTLFLQLAMFR